MGSRGGRKEGGGGIIASNVSQESLEVGTLVREFVSKTSLELASFKIDFLRLFWDMFWIDRMFLATQFDFIHIDIYFLDNLRRWMNLSVSNSLLPRVKDDTKQFISCQQDAFHINYTGGHVFLCGPQKRDASAIDLSHNQMLIYWAGSL